ncbi:YdcH family protein [Kiloniella laminariae]|uniref:YdcH family protein n=1 Tax=Kiloniella laminariae TaxID=454162 RepID=UPI0003785B5F|nr:YdcH family protein [Kiloniella laminariae]
MAAAERIESLRVKHGSLENAIDRENHRPLPDESLLMSLKKEKLRVKDELQHLSTVQ